jgi:hypothetical protein
MGGISAIGMYVENSTNKTNKIPVM